MDAAFSMEKMNASFFDKTAELYEHGNFYYSCIVISNLYICIRQWPRHVELMEHEYTVYLTKIEKDRPTKMLLLLVPLQTNCT